MREDVLNLLDDFARGILSWQEAQAMTTAMIGRANMRDEPDPNELVLAALLNGFCQRAHEESARGGTGSRAKTVYVDATHNPPPSE